jgi:hypothetical protein
MPELSSAVAALLGTFILGCVATSSDISAVLRWHKTCLQ